MLPEFHLKFSNDSAINISENFFEIRFKICPTSFYLQELLQKLFQNKNPWIISLKSFQKLLQGFVPNIYSFLQIFSNISWKVPPEISLRAPLEIIPRLPPGFFLPTIAIETFMAIDLKIPPRKPPKIFRESSRNVSLDFCINYSWKSSKSCSGNVLTRTFLRELFQEILQWFLGAVSQKFLQVFLNKWLRFLLSPFKNFFWNSLMMRSCEDSFKIPSTISPRTLSGVS